MDAVDEKDHACLNAASNQPKQRVGRLVEGHDEQVKLILHITRRIDGSSVAHEAPIGPIPLTDGDDLKQGEALMAIT